MQNFDRVERKEIKLDGRTFGVEIRYDGDEKHTVFTVDPPLGAQGHREVYCYAEIVPAIPSEGDNA